MSSYAIIVATVGPDREPLLLGADQVVLCGWCDELLRAGDTVWVFDDVPLDSSSGAQTCTGCMLRRRHPNLTGSGRLRVVGVQRVGEAVEA